MHPDPRGRTRSLRAALAALAAGLAVTISAASLPTLAQEGPKAPVVGLLDAIEDERFDELGSFFCAEYADEATSMDMTAEVVESLPAGLDPQDLLDALVFSVQDRDIDVRDETAAMAAVSLDATLTVSVEQDAAMALVAASFESLGVEPSDEMLAAAVAELDASVAGQSQSISEEVIVIRGLDGVWVICSPLGEDDDEADPTDDAGEPAGRLRSGDPGPERPGRGGEDDAGG